MNADTTEQSDDPTKSEEMSNRGSLVNGNNQSGSVTPITDTSAEAVSVGLINGSQPEYGVGGNGQGQMKSGQDADILVQEDNLASVTLDSVEGKISDYTLTAAERQEELCEKLVSEVVNHDLPPQTETLQNLDASEGANSVAPSAKISTSTEAVQIALGDETHENIDASVGVKEVSHSTEESRPVGAVVENTLPKESLLSAPSAKPDRSTQTLDSTEHSDAASTVSSIDKEVKPKKSLAGGENAGIFDGGEKCDMNGNENRNLESKDSFSVDTVSAPGSALEDDQTTRVFEKDVDHCEEKSNRKLLETRNEKCEGASMEIQEILDPTMPSDNSTEFPSSCAVDGDARNLEELSKNDSSPLESWDDGLEKSVQGHSTGKVTEVLGSAGLGAELNHDIGDVSSLENPVSPVISELPDNIHVTQNVVKVESVNVAETVSELKDYNEVVASETTPEQSISKQSLFTDSELLSGNSANDSTCMREVAKASESIDTDEVTAKLDHENNGILLKENSESPTPSVHEVSPTSKCLNVTSLGVEERHSSEDFSTSKSVGIVSNAELDGNVLESDKCSVTPSLKEPVPSTLESQDLHETSATGEDKTVINVEDVTGVNSKSLQAEVDDKLTKRKDGVSAMDLSGSSSSRSDSLEANCGSVISGKFSNSIRIQDCNRFCETPNLFTSLRGSFMSF